MVKIQENVNKFEEEKLQNILIIIIKLLYEKQSNSLISHGYSAYADDTSNLTCIFLFSLKGFIVSFLFLHFVLQLPSPQETGERMIVMSHQ